MVDYCELFRQNLELKRDNYELKIKNDELQSIKESLESKVMDLQTDVSSLKENVNMLIKDNKMLKNNHTKMARRLYSLAPVGFRTIIEELIDKGYHSDNITNDYLKALKQYFSRFIHDGASNILPADPEEMSNWIEAYLEDNSSVDKEFKFKRSKKVEKISLNKLALMEIVEFTKQKTEEEEEEEAEI